MIKNKKLILLFLSFLLVIVSVGVFILLKSPVHPKPQIVSVFPSPGATDISRWPDIEVVFDQEVSPSKISFSPEPFVPMDILTEKEAGEPIPPNKVIYVPKQKLEGTTTYKITLKFKFGGEYSWEFTTTEVEAGAARGWGRGFKKQMELYYQKNPPEEVEILNKIIDRVIENPNSAYFGDGFWIEYAGRTQTFGVHLCQEPFESTKKGVEEWFNQQGMDKLVKLKPEINWLYGCEPPKIIPKVLPTP